LHRSPSVEQLDKSMSVLMRKYGFDYAMIWTNRDGHMIISAEQNVPEKMCRLRQVQEQRQREKRMSTDLGSDERHLLDTTGTVDATGQSYSFPMGVGLPGRVSESGEFEWVIPENEPVDGQLPFARRKVALEAGIKTVVGVAVAKNGAVLELGSKQVIEEDMAIVNDIKTAIGALVLCDGTLG